MDVRINCCISQRPYFTNFADLWTWSKYRAHLQLVFDIDHILPMKRHLAQVFSRSFLSTSQTASMQFLEQEEDSSCIIWTIQKLCNSSPNNQLEFYGYARKETTSVSGRLFTMMSSSYPRSHCREQLICTFVFLFHYINSQNPHINCVHQGELFISECDFHTVR